MPEAQASKQSQCHKLRSRLEEAGFTHGESARVHLPGLALQDSQEGLRGYFCRVGRIQVIERLEEGDGKALPEEADLRGIVFPGKGLHCLENAVVRSNGRMRIEADEKTEVRREGPLAKVRHFFRHLAARATENSFLRS